MPAKSESQRKLFAIADHEPDKLYSENKSLTKLPRKTLHDFAATSGLKKKSSGLAKMRDTDGDND